MWRQNHLLIFINKSPWLKDSISNKLCIAYIKLLRTGPQFVCLRVECNVFHEEIWKDIIFLSSTEQNYGKTFWYKGQYCRVCYLLCTKGIIAEFAICYVSSYCHACQGQLVEHFYRKIPSGFCRITWFRLSAWIKFICASSILNTIYI